MVIGVGLTIYLLYLELNANNLDYSIDSLNILNRKNSKVAIIALIPIFLIYISYLLLELHNKTKLMENMMTNHKNDKRKILREKLGLEIRLRNHSFFDYYTKLPNRKYMEQIFLTELKESRRELCVMVINIDNYHNIVNSFGYNIALKYILAYGNMLEKYLRDFGKLFHIEANKFAFSIFPSVDQNLCVKKFIKNARKNISIDGIKLYNQVSVGLASAKKDYDNLINSAELARAYAKNNSLNYYFFTKELENRNLEYINTVSEVHDAIIGDMMELYYQPKITISDHPEITGVEALIRWNHPEKGVITPDKFIPFLEETALINDLSRWVIEKACKTLKTWSEQGINVKIAVNISIVNIYQINFINFLKAMLQKYDIKEGMLELEITERKMIDDFDHVLKSLHAIKKMGVNLSIDDFGTGYSSLSYIKKLPIDTIKIDRMFITNILNDRYNQKIVKSAISIARNFNINIVAEGIENIDELQLLKKMRCRVGQGYYFSRPLNEDKLLSWIKDFTKK